MSMIMPMRYRPSAWTLMACFVAAIGLAAWWATMHPGIWGRHEFEGMAQTLLLAWFSMVCAPVVFVLAVIGMLRKDPLAFVLLVVTGVLTWCFYSRRDTSIVN
jgi:FtsH-binding integral membrane protein